MSSVREVGTLHARSARLWASLPAAQTRRWLAQPGVRTALGCTLALRIATVVFAALITLLLNNTYVQVTEQMNLFGADMNIYVLPTPVRGPEAYLTSPWLRWDADHYISIAQDGYSYDAASAFLPLYPLLIRFGSYLTGGNLIVSALLISTVATFFAFLFLYRLALRVTQSPRVAGYSVLVAALLPIAFYFVAPYTESLFLALSLGCMLEVLDGRWARAALFAAAATFTRQQGVLLGLLALPALVRSARDFWVQRGEGLRRRLAALWRTGRWPALLAMTPAGVYGVWLLLLRFALDRQSPYELLTSSSGWRQHFTFPVVAILTDIQTLLREPQQMFDRDLHVSLDTAATLLATLSLILAWRRLPRAIWLYLFACWCLALVKVDPAGNTTSAARYLLEALPLCIIPALWMARLRPALRVAVITLGAYVWSFYFGAWVLWVWVN